MTGLLIYVGIIIPTCLFINYALHQSNKEWDEKMEELEDYLYRNSGH